MEGRVLPTNLIGTRQGSVIGPILSNIYLDKFDKMVEEEASKFQVGVKPVRHKEYHRVATAVSRAREKGDSEKAAELAKRLNKLPYTDYKSPKFKKMVYCRYTDD